MHCISLDAGRGWLLLAIPPCHRRPPLDARHVHPPKNRRLFSASVLATPRHDSRPHASAGTFSQTKSANTLFQRVAQPQKGVSSPPSSASRLPTASGDPQARQQPKPFRPSKAAPISHVSPVSSSQDERRTSWPDASAANGHAASQSPASARRKYTPEEKVCLKINKRIVAAVNVEELLRIIELQLPQFNTVNIVTAFHRLARVSSGGPSLKAAA